MGAWLQLSASDALDAAWEALRGVYDPELYLDVVSLGLVYDVRAEGDGLVVDMTMTTPGCPAQDYIVGGVESRLAEEPGVTGAFVTVAWDPPWSPQRMSAEAKAHFRIREDTE